MAHAVHHARLNLAPLRPPRGRDGARPAGRAGHDLRGVRAPARPVHGQAHQQPAAARRGAGAGRRAGARGGPRRRRRLRVGEGLVRQGRVPRGARRDARAEARRDARHRRRIRLGQDHARHGAARAAADRRRRSHARRHAARRRRPHDAARDAPAHAGRVPGPVRVAVTADDDRRHRRRGRRAAHARTDERAAPGAHPRDAGRGRADRGPGHLRRADALPARVLGRAAAADRDRARRDPAPRGAGARRADVRARRLRAAAGAEAARRAAGEVRDELRVHQPRPGGRARDVAPRAGDEGRRHRRAGHAVSPAGVCLGRRARSAGRLAALRGRDRRARLRVGAARAAHRRRPGAAPRRAAGRLRRRRERGVVGLAQVRARAPARAWRAAALDHLAGDIDAGEAIELSARLLEADPLDEAALRAHMSWLARGGQAARARQAYREFVERLATISGSRRAPTCRPCTTRSARAAARATGAAAPAQPAAIRRRLRRPHRRVAPHRRAAGAGRLPVAVPDRARAASARPDWRSARCEELGAAISRTAPTSFALEDLADAERTRRAPRARDRHVALRGSATRCGR